MPPQLTHQPQPHMPVCQFFVYIFENWKKHKTLHNSIKRIECEKTFIFFLLFTKCSLFFLVSCSAPAPAPYHAPSYNNAPAYHSSYSSGKCTISIQLHYSIHFFQYLLNFVYFQVTILVVIVQLITMHQSCHHQVCLLTFFYLFLLISIETKKILQFFSHKTSLSLKSIHVRNNLTYFFYNF